MSNNVIFWTYGILSVIMWGFIGIDIVRGTITVLTLVMQLAACANTFSFIKLLKARIRPVDLTSYKNS